MAVNLYKHITEDKAQAWSLEFWNSTSCLLVVDFLVRTTPNPTTSLSDYVQKCTTSKITKILSKTKNNINAELRCAAQCLNIKKQQPPVCCCRVHSTCYSVTEEQRCCEKGLCGPPLEAYLRHNKSSHPCLRFSLTQANNAKCLATDTSSTTGHLPNLLHTRSSGSLPEGLVHPGDSSVQVEDQT